MEVYFKSFLRLKNSIESVKKDFVSAVTDPADCKKNAVTKCLRAILGGPARNRENCRGRWHHLK